MKKETTAAHGGAETNSAPQSQDDPPPEAAPSAQPPYDDDAYRKCAVEELSVHLLRGGALLEHCETLADASYSDRVSAITAAAKLINANAQLAKALAQMVQVERRSRTIVETVQRPNPKTAGLNSIFLTVEKSKAVQGVLERILRPLLSGPQHEPQRLEPPEPPVTKGSS